MISSDQAYAAFRDANPAPAVEVADLPSPLEALRTAQGTPPPTPSAPPPGRRAPVGLLTAAAVFLVVVVIGALAVLLTGGSQEFVDEPLPPPSTTIPSTTTPPTTTAPTTTAAPVIEPQTQALLDQFAAAYSSGDFDAFAPLLDPELELEILIEQDPAVVWDLAEVREQFGFYRALNTSMDLEDCRTLSSEAVSCLLLRTDDLVRIQGLEPARDVRVALRFADGLVTSWEERPAKGDNYQLLAVAPFARWLDENHPEVPNPKIRGGAPWWTPRGDIVAQLPALVAEYAESLGVTLDE